MSPGLMKLRPTLLLLTLGLALGAVGCGTRSSIPEPQIDIDVDAGTSADGGGERSCPPNCTVGHECCAGSCDGAAVEMPSDCCTCLPGEVSSFMCGGACGG